jgi:hypothetical protein
MFRRIVVWKHGLIILLFYGGLGTAIGFVSIGVPVFLIGGLLGVSVQRMGIFDNLASLLCRPIGARNKLGGASGR